MNQNLRNIPQQPTNNFIEQMENREAGIEGFQSGCNNQVFSELTGGYKNKMNLNIHMVPFFKKSTQNTDISKSECT